MQCRKQNGFLESIGVKTHQKSVIGDYLETGMTKLVSKGVIHAYAYAHVSTSGLVERDVSYAQVNLIVFVHSHLHECNNANLLI